LGFLYGMGRSQDWLSARQGGPLAPQAVTVALDGHISSIPKAASMRITVTEPSGTIDAPITCSATPCSVSVNRTAGNYRLAVSYLDAGGQVLSTGNCFTVAVQ